MCSGPGSRVIKKTNFSAENLTHHVPSYPIRSHLKPRQLKQLQQHQPRKPARQTPNLPSTKNCTHFINIITIITTITTIIKNVTNKHSIPQQSAQRHQRLNRGRISWQWCPGLSLRNCGWHGAPGRVYCGLHELRKEHHISRERKCQTQQVMMYHATEPKHITQTLHSTMFVGPAAPPWSPPPEAPIASLPSLNQSSIIRFPR
jgi:hypothetical protein